MKTTAVLILAAALLALSACDQPKPRGESAAPATPSVKGPSTGLSAGLVQSDALPGFYLDNINEAADPMNRPGVVAGGKPLTLAGFAFDAAASRPARGVDLVVDGQVYATAYGHLRQDVADNLKTPALAYTGFTATLPASVATPGEHTVVMRVILADGAAYADSPSFRFTVR